MIQARSDIAAGPPPEIVSVLDDLRFEAIMEALDMATSYAISAREAAWRGDKSFLGVHLQQLRLSTIAAMSTFKELGVSGEEKATAA
jgi:hypothetical protein